MSIDEIAGYLASPKVQYAIIGVVGTLALVLFARVYRDMKAGEELEKATTDDLFSPLAEAFKSGQMSEEEYLRIRGSLEKEGKNVAFLGPMVRRAKTTPSPAPAPEPAPGDEPPVEPPPE